jgi:hypothetical protein
MTKPAITISGEHDNVQLPRCPNCGAAIEMHATVDQWLQPHDWHFYGYTGQRWIRCRGRHNGYEFVHFLAQVNRRGSNRIAWIRVAETNDTAVQPVLL